MQTWTGSVHGSPPTGGGGGAGSIPLLLGTLELTSNLGRVNNVTVRGLFNDEVSLPVHAYQTNSGEP